MSIIDWSKDDTVAVISMNNGENRHNLDFANRMLEVLDQVNKDTSVTAVISTSGDAKNFCQGVDVQSLDPWRG